MPFIFIYLIISLHFIVLEDSLLYFHVTTSFWRFCLEADVQTTQPSHDLCQWQSAALPHSFSIPSVLLPSLLWSIYTCNIRCKVDILPTVKREMMLLSPVTHVNIHSLRVSPLSNFLSVCLPVFFPPFYLAFKCVKDHLYIIFTPNTQLSIPEYTHLRTIR